MHLLNETRGSTLEVVVSRMKLRGSSVRFLVVSATVPNIGDVADWVGNQSGDGLATVKEVRDLTSVTQVRISNAVDSSEKNSGRASCQSLFMDFPDARTPTTSYSRRR